MNIMSHYLKERQHKTYTSLVGAAITDEQIAKLTYQASIIKQQIIDSGELV